MSPFVSANAVAEIAALIGDPARANILLALMGGQALTAGELAWHAGVTAQTTSGHLAKLSDMNLLAMEKQGRHRYFRLATPEVAQTVHSLMAVAATGPKRHRPTGPKDEAMRLARVCYDHLAGTISVALADYLAEQGYIRLGDGAGILTESGMRFLCEFGIDLERPTPSRRPICRTCLDWSERRPHLAGQLGAALLQRVLELGWVLRVPDSRALRVTARGMQGFRDQFGFAPFPAASDERHFARSIASV